MGTKIEWAEETWNPITGCTKVSEGCRNCYAERMAKRLAGRYGYPADEPFQVTLHPNRLDQPLRWRKPRTVFVCSMGDLFHEDVPDAFISKVFRRMLITPRHTFLVLTKRPSRMLEYLTEHVADDLFSAYGSELKWPAENVWLGVSAENQQTADERIPLLFQTPAAVHFVNLEPLLGAVDLRNIVIQYSSDGNHDMLDALNGMAWFKHTCITDPHLAQSDSGVSWVIAGGESGPGARPMHPDWVRGLRDQCQAAGVPFFFKQMGGHPNKRAAPTDIPLDLRIREYPENVRVGF